jgi:hypothetical protein
MVSEMTINVPIDDHDNDDGEVAVVEIRPHVAVLFKAAEILADIERQRMQIGRPRLHETLARKYG